MKDFFSKYSREARLYPTAIGLVPFYLWQYFFLSEFIPSDLYSDLYSVVVLSNVTLTAIVLYFVSEFFVRYPSKLLEDRVFRKKQDIPTTQLLLFSDSEYSDNFKNRFRNKVKSDFSLQLSDSVEESRNEEEARKKIKEVIGLIIKRVGDGHLVLKHNISYGFFRNLWGASCIGLTFAIVLSLTLFMHQSEYTSLSLMLVIPYMLYITFGISVIRHFAEAYARKLIEEYMEKDK